jgi:hypothetical protein
MSDIKCSECPYGKQCCINIHLSTDSKKRDINLVIGKNKFMPVVHIK